MPPSAPPERPAWRRFLPAVAGLVLLSALVAAALLSRPAAPTDTAAGNAERRAQRHGEERDEAPDGEEPEGAAAKSEGPVNVAVRVTADDKPVAGARVQLLPIDAAHGAVAPACPCQSDGGRGPDEAQGEARDDSVTALDDSCAECPAGDDALAELAQQGAGALAEGEVRTSAEGLARFDSVSDELDYAVQVDAPGHRPAFLLVSLLQEHEEPEVVELQPAREFHVRTVDTQGRAVRAEVSAFCPEPFQAYAGRGVEDGVVFPRLPSGCELQLLARAPGYLSTRGTLDESDEAPTLILQHPVTIHGRVLHGESPVAGAELSLEQTEVGDPRITTSDSEGRFRFTGIRPGHFVLTGSRGGLRGQLESDIEDDDGSTPELALVLAETAAIEGLVTDSASGAAVPGAEIQLSGEESFGSAETDEKGHFRLEIAPGSYQLRATEAGHLSVTRPISLGEGETARIDLGLGAGTRLEGRVLDGRGSPLEGARVYVEDGSRDEGGGRHLVETDADGHFALAGLVDGAALLVVDADGHPRVNQGIRLPSQAVTVQLSDGAELDGVVLGPNGPLAGVEVSCAPEGPRASMEMAATDAQGRFHMHGLATGPAQVSATSEGLAPSPPQMVALREGEPAHVELHLSAGLSVRGRVVDDSGHPVPSAMVEAYSNERTRRGLPGSTMTATADTEGRFALSGLLEGEYQLLAFRDGLAPGDAQVVQAGAVDVVLKLARTGRVTGRVVTTTGQPVRRFTVQGQEFRTADGTFVLRDLAPEATQLLFDGAFPAVSIPVEVRAGETADVGTVRVEEGLSLSGRVRFSDGRPAAGVRVTELPPGAQDDAPTGAGDTFDDAQLQEPHTATTDAQGRFSFAHLRPGRYALQATGSGVATSSVAAEPGPADVELVLAASATLRGRAQLADGTPLAEGEVYFGNRAFTQQAKVIDGQFTLGDLPPGQALLTVIAQGGSQALSGNVTVNVAAGQELAPLVVVSPSRTEVSEQP